MLSAAMMLTACGAKETAQESGTAQESSETPAQVANETTDEQTADAGGLDEEALVQKAVEAAGSSAEQARYSLADDFDGDGSTEAFVYIGDEKDEEFSTCTGEVWFVSDKTCEKIEEEFSFVVRDNKVINTLSADDKNFILVERSFMSSSATDVFYVFDGECKESAVSGRGGFYKSDIGDYCVNVDTYDMSLEFDSAADADDPNVYLEYIPVLEKGMYTGHTWKEYFYYYDKASADFKEYGTKELTEQELATACGFDLAGEIKAEGYQMGKIYRRDNGVINVNYYMRTDNADGSVIIDFKNATYNEKTKAFMYEGGDGEKPWQKSDCGGIFDSAVQ